MKKQHFVEVVPAGKRPKRAGIIKRNKFASFWTWLKGLKIRRPLYLAYAACFVLALLAFHNHMSKFVYVVVVNDVEIGTVENPGEIEEFLDGIAARCSELYGFQTKPGDNVVLLREYRPGSISSPETVKEKLRSELNLVADAHMIMVDGTPAVPVTDQEDFLAVVEILKERYVSKDFEVRTLDVVVLEDLQSELFSVSPDYVLSPEEAASALILDQADYNGPQNGLAVLDEKLDYTETSSPARSFPGNLPQADSEGYFNDSNNEYNSSAHSHLSAANTIASGDVGVRVQTVEEVSVYEPISYDTIYRYTDELWLVQSEVTEPGEDGLREVIYRITRENGIETEREIIRQITHKFPKTEKIDQGVAAVPAMGTGQFVWPVVEGELTPNRGFSEWHTGIDIHAPSGTDILAADHGVVTFNGYGGSQGNYLIIYHGDYWTLYLHNQQNLVKVGEEVEQGQVIAWLGSTGRSTGPHLHFEVRRDDGTGEWQTYYQHEPIDPLQFFAVFKR